jgi:ribonuclease-3
VDVLELEQKTGIKIKNKNLFRQAFTHKSYSRECNRQNFLDNERLEFFGDAVLEFVVSKYLFQRFPKKDEGELTRIKSSVVCEAALAEFAKELDFGAFVYLGKGEDRSGGRERSALLADLFEAFLGALYFDQGIDEVEKFLVRTVFTKIDKGWLTDIVDVKSRLQELVQRAKIGQLEYKITSVAGPSHNRIFAAEVYLGDTCLGKGLGSSKKTAQQHAALHALENWKK